MKTVKGAKGVPFVVRYHNLLKNVVGITSKNFLSLNVNGET